jgi:serine/threonine protein kinase
VVHHALIELSERGRRFDGFDADELRAELESPAAFACLLEPPVQDDGRKMQTLTLAGASPDLLMGGLGSHGDVAYSVGILLHLLLVGQAPFFDARSVLERIERRASEDPPPLAGYRPDLDPRLCLWLDRVIARDPSKGRSGGALAIELGLLELLEPWPEWHGAALRVLTTASSLPEPEPGGDPEPAPRVRPTLIEGQKVSLWTVETHMAFGGEAELYRVRDDEGRRGVLKLWYDERVDPFSEGFRQFRLRMMECAKHPGFPAVYESDKLTRGRPRAYMVLEEVRGRSWRDRIRSGDRPKAPELLELGEALLEALAVAQDQFGLVGDVSAGNVMLRPAPGGEAPVLLDVAMPDRDRAAQVGYGTPGYLAPEVLGGQAPDGGSDVFSAGAPLYCAPEQLSGEGVGTPSDLYALGLLLYDLVLGRPPSQDGVRRALHLNRLAKAVASGDRPTELTHHDGDPRLAPLLALLASLTHPEPERRPTEVVLP